MRTAIRAGVFLECTVCTITVDEKKTLKNALILHVVLSAGRGEISCTVRSPSGWRIDIQSLIIRHVWLLFYIYYPYCTFFVPSTVSAAASLLYTYKN